MTEPRQWPQLNREGGAINFFLYMQDGTRMPWRVADTLNNRLFVDWVQVCDSPFTGKPEQVAEAKRNRVRTMCRGPE